ncbi:MAG: Uma2 family endonuclease [Chloroflexota bacterium]
MVLEREKLYTAEEFWDIAQLPENQDKRLELEDGVIVEMGSSSPANTVTAMRIGYFLNGFVIPHDLGYVTGADGGFKVGPKRVRQPDVGFISKVRALKLPKRFDLAPDLAVEVVSPDEDVFKKAKEYIRSGTRIVWAVYADEKVVDVITPTQDGEFHVQELTINDVLDGGDVLPGFSLPVRDIFPA